MLHAHKKDKGSTMMCVCIVSAEVDGVTSNNKEINLLRGIA